MNTAINSDALIAEYDTEAIIESLKNLPNINMAFLTTLTLDQLCMVQDIELQSAGNENIMHNKAKLILDNFPWPAGLSKEAMDYQLFEQHYIEGVSGDIAFYYYIFDRCIPRRGRNKNKFFMDRLATFAKASFRELWEESQTWTVQDNEVILEPNKASSKKAALLPKEGEFAADHIMKVVDNKGQVHTAEVEEKPCLSITGAIEKYKDPVKRYNAKYLMLYLERTSGEYPAGFYIHNYERNLTSVMIPKEPFPGYPSALQYIDSI